MTDERQAKWDEFMGESGIYGALHAFQAEAPTLQTDKINPAFKSKYLSLDALMTQVTPVMNKHGLIWITRPEMNYDTGAPVLIYELRHTTGGVIAGAMPLMLTKQDPQGMGSAITYARRQSLMAVLGLSADEDDDANVASRPRYEVTTDVPRVTGRAPRPTTATASAKQRGLINGKAGEQGLDPIALAHIVQVATGHEPSEFVSQDQAKRSLDMWLERLPAKNVDDVLAGIEKAA